MKQSIIPMNDRIGKMCLCCGSAVSVKYQFSSDDGSVGFFVCNRCALSQREQIKTILERMEQVGYEFKVGDFVIYTHNADGIKRGSVSRICRIDHDWIGVSVYHENIAKTVWYRTDRRIPFQLSRKEDRRNG